MGFAVTDYSANGDTPLIGLLRARKQSNTDQLNLSLGDTTLGVNSDRYDKVLVPSKVIDEKIDDALHDSGLRSPDRNIVSVRKGKERVQTNANADVFNTAQKFYQSESAAKDAVTAIFQHSGDGTTTILSSADAGKSLLFSTNNVSSFFLSGGTGFTLNVGSEITQPGVGATAIVAIQTSRSQSDSGSFRIIVKPETIGTFTYNQSGVGNTIFISPSGGTPGTAFTDFAQYGIMYVGMGSVYRDDVIVHEYPKLEPVDSSADTPFDGEEFNLISSISNSNLGVGVGNTFYRNGSDDSSIPSFNEEVSWGSGKIPSFIGDVFAYDPSAIDSSYTDEISAGLATVKYWREQVDTLISNANTLKGMKKDFAVNVWSLSKSESKMAADNANIDSLITILENEEYGGPY